MVKKIVIIGPESTGKSTLCQQLAAHFNTIWCAEYAREYLNTHGTKYNEIDLLKIAKGQLALEANALQTAQQQNKQLIFVDTDMQVMKVWSEYVFNSCHPFILQQAAQQQQHLYLLCNIDLPWVKDELREYENEQPRKELFNIYKDILVHQNTPWVLIQGNYQQRLQTAIAAVEKYGSF
jgi:NadR type nicotinamide-nucleotide adenylyltransferase